jgi:two-component system response regulator YesN
LSNLFKKETGVAFSNYVSSIRVEKAKMLLAGTKMRMTDIAEHTGFENSSYFTTVFKQLIGMSPSEYRKSQECRIF